MSNCPLWPVRGPERDKLRALGHIARVAEVPDADKPVALPLQQHEIGWRNSAVARVESQHSGTAVDESQDEAPILGLRIVAEIAADLCATVHPCSRDELQTHLVGQHVAHSVEVARVETID